jgi:hypothetical protein
MKESKSKQVQTPVRKSDGDSLPPDDLDRPSEYFWYQGKSEPRFVGSIVSTGAGKGTCTAFVTQHAADNSFFADTQVASAA